MLICTSNLFRKFGFEDRLCVILTHRHFELEEGEKLVERGHISTPWMVDIAPESITSRISGRSWAFIDGSLTPYEYKFRDDPNEAPFQPPPELIEDLHALLTERDLVDRLGK